MQEEVAVNESLLKDNFVNKTRVMALQRAVADLRIGQTADVRLTPYRQRETPMVDARVVYVSADSLVDRHTGAPYFARHAEPDHDSLAKAGDLVVSPGMGAEVFARTRERTTLDFLLEPLVNAMRRSLREH